MNNNTTTDDNLTESELLPMLDEAAELGMIKQTDAWT